jgi:2-polyprenyl-3-methyl-5-hydroxy-6-metoxy-1,4-benzoquinol methylase
VIEPASASDPRWGSEGRDEKAQAILQTLVAVDGPGIVKGTWLDVGCGSGMIAACLATRVERMIGVDPESWARWSDFSDQCTNLEFHAASYRDLPNIVPHGSVDVVVCNQVYEHVDSPVDLLASIHSILAERGICYFAGPNLLWPIEPHVYLPFVHWVPREWALKALRGLGSERHRDLDAYSLDVWRLRKLFGRTGFRAQSVFAQRARAGVDTGDGGLMLRAAAWLPASVEAALLPILPGFNFILRKADPPTGG